MRPSEPVSCEVCVCSVSGWSPPQLEGLLSTLCLQVASMKMFQVQFHTGFVPRNATTVKFAKYVGVTRGRGQEGQVHGAHLPCTPCK